jgi:hypothetical protein
MQSNAAIARCIAEAERRVDAIEVLCEIITGQVKGERRELQAIRAALAAPVPGPEGSGQVAPGDTSIAMLEG